ncbi:MAG: hypothetical protein OQK50_02410 [Deltaproteobacteria bacterium]|nr:hypothetical protein [Deltaproteobacteria bacterium]
MSQATYLIVEQQLKPPENLPEVLKELSQKHQLDIYQCRQRLVGRGLSLLTRGETEPLGKVSKVLKDAGYFHWVVSPSKPGFVPHRIRSLEIQSDHIIFNCQKKTVVFPKNSTILAVFAETSGELADKSVKQLLSSHAYRGMDYIRHLEDTKIHKTILQGKPVLDLYLLDDKSQVADAVRIFPGKFDPKGLGEQASVSSKQNLALVLRLAEEYAKDFHLFTDFGLVNLPGCTLRREDPDNPQTQRQNLISLARYGWLMTDLLRTGAVNPPQQEKEKDFSGAVTAAMLMQNPLLAGAGQLNEMLPIAKEISTEIDKASAIEEKTIAQSPDTADPGLPAPPPAQSTANWTKPGFWIGTGGSLGVMAFFMLFDFADNQFLNKAAYHAFATGAIPLTLAGFTFCSAFYFLRMKRQIENTPTSKVRSVAMGMVEVKGQALRKFALVSPLSQSPCVFYRLTKYRREKNNQWKVNSVSSSANVPFLLEDETGRVEIDPAGCRVSAGTRQEGTPGQVGLTRLSDKSDDKWVEETIVEGTLLYVLGAASVKPSTGPILTEQKTEALRELKRNPQKLQQFDQDGDGKIGADEWDNARAAVEQKLIRASLNAKSERKKQEEHIVIGKAKGRPLIISETHSEDHLTARYLLYSIPLFFVAAIATGGAIYLLINYLK